MSALNRIFAGRASLFFRNPLGRVMQRADLSEKTLNAHVRKNVGKDGEWKGALPEEPNRFTENAPDLEGADLVSPGKALAAFVGFLGLIGAGAVAVSFMVPERPYALRKLPYNNLWVERGYDPALAPEPKESKDH